MWRCCPEERKLLDQWRTVTRHCERRIALVGELDAFGMFAREGDHRLAGDEQLEKLVVKRMG